MQNTGRTGAAQSFWVMGRRRLGKIAVHAFGFGSGRLTRGERGGLLFLTSSMISARLMLRGDGSRWRLLHLNWRWGWGQMGYAHLYLRCCMRVEVVRKSNHSVRDEGSVAAACVHVSWSESVLMQGE